MTFWHHGRVKCCRYYTKMRVVTKLLLLMCFWGSVYSNTIVSGIAGEDVVLPCTVKYKEEFSYDALDIRWKTEDIFVHHFFNGNFQEEYQNKIFKGRTQLFYTEFPKGNLSLLLKNIKTYDAGIYECLVFISKHMYTMKTELVVQDTVHGFPNESTVVNVSVFVLILGVVMGLVVFLRRRKRSRGRTGIPCGKKSEDLIQDRRQRRRRRKNLSMFQVDF